MRVYPLQRLYGFPAPMTALLPASDVALSASQSRLSGLEVAVIVDARPIGERGECLQPDIEAHGFVALRQGGGLACDAEAHIPASGFALEANGLDRARERPIPLSRTLQPSPQLGNM